MIRGWTARTVASVLILGSMASLAWAASAPQGGPSQIPLGSRHEPRFDEVDYGRLELQARQRGLDVTEKDLGPLVRRNFQHLFWRCLNQRRFLVAPPPRKVAETMLKVLELNRDLMALLDDARALAAEGGRLDEAQGHERRLRVVRDVRLVARELKKSFRGTFVELEKAGYKVSLPAGEEERGRFVSFLLQAERIGRLLTRQVDDYFFAEAPGAVAVSDYEEASIGVLSEAMEKLAEMSEKSLRR